ncbi:MAG: hypothetical protein VKL39_24515, partial [Leptolyngbyaceae bacterium]|nr:hypothetical protein [Leptolyngbyaceae bacterium]
ERVKKGRGRKAESTPAASSSSRRRKPKAEAASSEAPTFELHHQPEWGENEWLIREPDGKGHHFVNRNEELIVALAHHFAGGAPITVHGKDGRKRRSEAPTEMARRWAEHFMAEEKHSERQHEPGRFGRMNAHRAAYMAIRRAMEKPSAKNKAAAEAASAKAQRLEEQPLPAY